MLVGGIEKQCSDTHASVITDVINCERPENDNLNANEIIQDVKVLRYILLDLEKYEKETKEAENIYQKLSQEIQQHTKKTKHDKAKNDKLIVTYLFAHRSYKHINKVNEAFNHLSPTSTLYQLLVDKFPSTPAILCVLTIVDYSISPYQFIANQLFNLMKKKKYDEFGYIFITRSEIDLDLIRNEFEKNDYGEGSTLKGWIINNLTGANNKNLRDILTNILDSFVLQEIRQNKKEFKEEPIQNSTNLTLSPNSNTDILILTSQKTNDEPQSPSTIDEYQALKERLDNNERALESFKRYIESVTEENKFGTIRSSIINAVQKVLTTQKASNVNLQVVATLAIVILFTEFAKFDAEMKPFSLQSRDKGWRNAWVKEISRAKNVPPNNDKTKFTFDNFFSTFQQFLPSAEEALQQQ